MAASVVHKKFNTAFQVASQLGQSASHNNLHHRDEIVLAISAIAFGLGVCCAAPAEFLFDGAPWTRLCLGVMEHHKEPQI